MRRNRVLALLGLLLAVALVAAACGDDDDSSAGDDAAATEAPTEEATTEPAEDDGEAMDDETAGADLDRDGDGEITIGVAAAGPRDDGGYYQALIDTATQLSEENGWNEPIVVDLIEPATAATELSNLAEQGVDIIAVGAGEIADPLADLVEQYPEVFWYCNCGAGYQPPEGLAVSQDNGPAIQFMAGAATGLVLQETGGDTVTMIGCCDLDFEIETRLAFEAGLQEIDPSYTLTYVPTGNFPFDFDNSAGAVEAFNAALDEGTGAVYPYLGGAHEPVVQIANENGIPVLSAGASDVCTRPGDLSWDIAVKFDGGDYAREIFPLIQSGEVQEGDVYFFDVGAPGSGSVVGADICEPTPEQQETLDAIAQRIADGEFADLFGEIQAEAFGGGGGEEGEG